MSEERNIAILRRQKKELTDKAIRDGGFYGKNGVWNSIITFSGDSRIYRERVETIIVRNNKEVFLKKKPNGEYFLPGGSTEKNISHIDQAVNECREEAHINVRNIESTGITYKVQHETPKWAKNECEVEWNGTYTEVYIAEYDSQYKGHVDEVDQDRFILSGTWYSTKECFKIFRKEHRDALLWYIKNHQQEEETTTESYIGNYFKNKRLLKKISRNPDIEKAAVDQMLDMLKREYSKLISTSKIQRAMKNKKSSEIAYSILSFDFDDGMSITIFISFDTEEFTPACAGYTDDLKYYVIVYPKFFKLKRENQIFTLLHEIGHIRLSHVDYRNAVKSIDGKDITNDYRLKMMTKGKVMYPEAYADLYAVLNGSSMYSVLSDYYNIDKDKEYDYRFTNAELANRYTKVFNQYRKYGLFESRDISLYDIACVAVYEMVYNNYELDYLTEIERDELYSIAYEYCINTKLKNNETVAFYEKTYEDELATYNRIVYEFEKSFSDCMILSMEKFIEEQVFEEKEGITMSTFETYKFKKKEILQYREKLDSTYEKLSSIRDSVYEENSNIDIFNKYKLGNNPKAAQISTIKNALVVEAVDILNSLDYKLKIKKESSKEHNDRLDHFIYLVESITSSERAKIPLNKFGIPDTRSYPLDSKQHVESAIILFPKAQDKYKPTLAKNILKAMKEYCISTDKIGKDTILYKYI